MNKKQLVVMLIITVIVFIAIIFFPKKRVVHYFSRLNILSETAKQDNFAYQIISEEEWKSHGGFCLQKFYKIKISHEIKTKEEAIPIINQLVKEISAKNKNIDETRIYLYDTDLDADYQGYGGIATVDWALDGKLGGKFGPEKFNDAVNFYKRNDKSRHKIDIFWHPEFESKLNLRLLLETLRETTDYKINILDNNIYNYDSQTGHLYIKIHEKIFTKESGYKERGYPDKITLDDLYSAASIIGVGYMKDYNEIKSCHFELVWKDKPIFVFKTTRGEFDKIPLKEFERNLYADKDRLTEKEDMLIKQGLLKGGKEYFDKHSKSEKELELKYYTKIFEYIKDKQIDTSNIISEP